MESKKPIQQKTGEFLDQDPEKVKNKKKAKENFSGKLQFTTKEIHTILNKKLIESESYIQGTEDFKQQVLLFEKKMEKKIEKKIIKLVRRYERKIERKIEKIIKKKEK